MQGGGERKNKFNFCLKCIFRNYGNQHDIRFRQREILVISSCDDCLSCNMRSDYLFSSWFTYWWSEDLAAGGGNWDSCTPVCNQVVEASAGNVLHCLFCSMDYMLCPHVEVLLTHVQTLILHIFFLVLAFFFCDLCKKQPKLRRISKPCWCLPYGDLSWDIFFLDFSDIFNITIPIWLLLLCVFQWEFIFCFSKICHRDYP